MNSPGNLRHLPNVISSVRLVSAPVLAWLAVAGFADAFAAILLVSLLSDVLDGWLARRMGVASATGALLDSIADILLTVAILIGIWFLHAEVYREDGWVIYGVVAMWTVAHIASLFRFGRLASFHTWLIRIGIAAFNIFALILFFSTYLPWLLYLAGVLCTLAALEHFAMLALLQKWTPDIPGGLLEVIKRRNGQSEKGS